MTDHDPTMLKIATALWENDWPKAQRVQIPGMPDTFDQATQTARTIYLKRATIALTAMGGDPDAQPAGQVRLSLDKTVAAHRSTRPYAPWDCTDGKERWDYQILDWTILTPDTPTTADTSEPWDLAEYIVGHVPEESYASIEGVSAVQAAILMHNHRKHQNERKS